MSEKRIEYAEVKRLFKVWQENGSMEEHGTDGRALLLWEDGKEVAVRGEDLIALLFYMRNHYLGEVRAARAALDQHGISADSLSLADGIHLLVGRMAKRDAAA